MDRGEHRDRALVFGSKRPAGMSAVSLPRGRSGSMVRLGEMAFGFPGVPPVQPLTYKLFISHAWDHEEYDSLVNLLKPDAAFRWVNFSVPKDNPIAMLLVLPKSIRTLVHELDDRIRRADWVLIITGMYVAHRQWIQSEIEAALELGKPTIGVAPRGQSRIPETARLAIEKAGGELVRWNRDSIISAIRRQARLEPPALGTPAPLENFFRNPNALPLSPSLAASLENILRKQPGPPPAAAASTSSDLINKITKGWPKK